MSMEAGKILCHYLVDTLKNISLKNYNEAFHYVFYGSDNINSKIVRWGNHETTTILNDFEYALAAFLALKHNDCDKFLKDCKEAEAKKAERPEIPCTVEDLSLIHI